MHVFFSSGEPSGDQHAAHLIAELRRRGPVEATGFGGPLMERAGCRLLFRMTDLAVMGVFQVLPLLLKFWRLYRQAARSFDTHRPDAVILIDFPGFNWHVARAAKKRGIPVIYYMPPQLWAWAPWRIKKVRKSVDFVLSGLPFERDWYAARGVKVAFVGHPFFDEVNDHPLDHAFLWERRASGGRKPSESNRFNVGVLPGSRHHELARNWPAMLKVMGRLAAKHRGVTFRVACYREKHREFLEDAYAKSGAALPIEFCVGKTPEVVELADCVLMVSGSVSLELLGRGTPGVVIYKTTAFTAAMARRLLTCKYVTLPNLIADRVVMPEFWYSGDDAPAVAAIAEILDGWLSDPAALAAKRAEMENLAATAAVTGGTRLAVDAILDHLNPSKPAKAAA